MRRFALIVTFATQGCETKFIPISHVILGFFKLQPCCAGG
jgi:hypothetical protein